MSKKAPPIVIKKDNGKLRFSRLIKGKGFSTNINKLVFVFSEDQTIPELFKEKASYIVIKDWHNGLDPENIVKKHFVE